MYLPFLDLYITFVPRGQDFAMGGDAPSVDGPLVQSQMFIESKIMRWEVLSLPSLDHLCRHKHSWRARACDGRSRAFRRCTTYTVTSIHGGQEHALGTASSIDELQVLT